ncbi:hypothetical protein GA0070609_3316 [Micromonospora echinaurantiaca]|uniref:Uncharacterized protein n=1 Tax=Micromonospora echinaurantiaca TaxID=47857 RepID=A0A1C5IHH4_9ACTN|nr:hypothetical protein GA0070609_3316 [Micromonospora echinaurantiaca]
MSHTALFLVAGLAVLAFDQYRLYAVRHELAALQRAELRDPLTGLAKPRQKRRRVDAARPTPTRGCGRGSGRLQARQRHLMLGGRRAERLRLVDRVRPRP